MINPSEISQVLKQQLESVNRKVAFEETGSVLEVGDGVAHVYGLDNVRANELVEFENGVKGVALNLEESNVGVILLNNVNLVTEGMKVRRVSSMCLASLWTDAARYRDRLSIFLLNARRPALYTVSL